MCHAIPNRHSYAEALPLNTALFLFLDILHGKKKHAKNVLELHNHYMEHKGDPEPGLYSMDTAILAQGMGTVPAFVSLNRMNGSRETGKLVRKAGSTSPARPQRW